MLNLALKELKSTEHHLLVTVEHHQYNLTNQQGPAFVRLQRCLQVKVLFCLNNSNLESVWSLDCSQSTIFCYMYLLRPYIFSSLLKNRDATNSLHRIMFSVCSLHYFSCLLNFLPTLTLSHNRLVTVQTLKAQLHTY